MADKSENLERRFIGKLECEERADGSAAPKLVGYAAVFNKETELYPGLRERISPGAFSRTLSEDADVRALVDHDPSKVIGRTKNGTLTLAENSKGLRAEIKPSDTTAGRDIVQSVQRGDVDQMSFGFVVRKQSWEDHDDGTTTRTLEDVDLFDVSAVTFPAYADTTIAVRSLEAYKAGKEEPVENEKPEEVEEVVEPKPTLNADTRARLAGIEAMLEDHVERYGDEGMARFKCNGRLSQG